MLDHSILGVFGLTAAFFFIEAGNFGVAAFPCIARRTTAFRTSVVGDRSLSTGLPIKSNFLLMLAEAERVASRFLEDLGVVFFTDMDFGVFDCDFIAEAGVCSISDTPDRLISSECPRGVFNSSLTPVRLAFPRTLRDRRG